MEFLRRKIAKEQSRDTGMAIVLLLLLVDIKLKRQGILFSAIALHVVNMVVPKIFGPVAIFWLGLSDLLGAAASRILFSILFFGVVTPIGVLRRWAGKDSLKLRAFKVSDESAMVPRNHIFVAKDIEKPY